MLTKHSVVIIISLMFSRLCFGQINQSKLSEVFAWKQIQYNIDGVHYTRDSDFERRPNGILFDQRLEDREKFYIQYNNVPIGFEVYQERVFVTVPRRQYGIPSTLNYVYTSSRGSPALQPYPDAESSKDLVSVYRPRVDVCGRLWMVDTGLLEVPGARQQVQKPSVVIYDLETNRRLLKYEFKDTDLVNERTPGGLTSITVDVTRDSCDDAFAYINDLATEGLVVFSLKQLDSWRIQHDSFKHDPLSLNFTVAGHVITWKDGLFGIALSDSDSVGKRTLYYHPLVSTQEFAVDTDILKNRRTFQSRLLGSRGKNTQSGCSGYHAGTHIIFYANVAQDAILCWNVNNKMTPENVGVATQDHGLLVYISDLKVIGDEVWVLVNQIPRFVLSSLNVDELNFYIHRAKVQDLIRGTICERETSNDSRMIFKEN